MGAGQLSLLGSGQGPEGCGGNWPWGCGRGRWWPLAGQNKWGPQLAPEFLRQVASSSASWGQVRKGEPLLAFWADPSLALASLHRSGLLGAMVVPAVP